ncbi:hypothetical protein VTL71DRAFT_9668 [Oculimacula yallundae]|uniref:Uncharacterized protein n=1 Tax=Oculimacula yallundae TaxID=86028 RepID=A0ABR4BRM1_9HELO
MTSIKSTQFPVPEPDMPAPETQGNTPKLPPFPAQSRTPHPPIHPTWEVLISTPPLQTSTPNPSTLNPPRTSFVTTSTNHIPHPSRFRRCLASVLSSILTFRSPPKRILPQIPDPEPRDNFANQAWDDGTFGERGLEGVEAMMEEWVGEV